MKHRKNFYLDDSTISYIEKFQDEKHLPTFTAALAEIIQEHQHKSDVPATKVLVEELSKQVAKELDSSLTRIRLGVNNADRNSDIILMLLNTLLSYSSYKTLVTEETPQLVRAKEIEKERIANFRQKKLNAPPQKEKNPENGPSDQELTIPEDDLIQGE